MLSYYTGSDASRDNGSVTFLGHFLSSKVACGEEFERCPNLTVLQKDNVVLVAVPMMEYIGLALFERSDQNLAYTQKSVINLTSLDLGCEVLSIFDYQVSGSSVLLANCLYYDNPGPRQLLDLIRIIMNSSNIIKVESVRRLYTVDCDVHSLSRLHFIVSQNFPRGVVIFASGSQIIFHSIDENYCNSFDINTCAERQRLSLVPPDDLVLYCSNTTFLFNLRNRQYTPFTRTADGLPIFCSKIFYCSYLSGVLSFHNNDVNRTLISEHDLRNSDVLNADEEIVWGECVQSKFVVFRTSRNNVIIFNLESSMHVKIGNSETTPRIFDNSFILLRNAGHTLVHSVQTGQLLQPIPQGFTMGYVMRSSQSIRDEQCVTSTVTYSTDGTTVPATVPIRTDGLSGGAIAGIVVGVVVVLIVILVVSAILLW